VIICAGWCLALAWHGSVWTLVAFAVLITFGGSILYAAMPNLMVEVAPPDRISEINGMSHVVRTVATAIGTQAATMLLASSTVTGTAPGQGTHPSPAAFVLCFGFVIACAAASIGVGLALPRRDAHPSVSSLRTTPEVS
jgi:MFS family permease